MNKISFETMSSIEGGKQLSDDCIKALIWEGVAYASLFTVSGPFAVILGACAIGGLISSAVNLGIKCS